jgi:hypothetical protein
MFAEKLSQALLPSESTFWPLEATVTPLLWTVIGALSWGIWWSLRSMSVTGTRGVRHVERMFESSGKETGPIDVRGTGELETNLASRVLWEATSCTMTGR